MVVDASSYAAYRPLDLDEWQADAVMLDIGELSGQVAALIFRDTSMFPRLDPDRPPGTAREFPAARSLRWCPNLVRHLGNLDEDVTTVQDSMTSMATHQWYVPEHLVESLQGLPAVHIIGVSGDAAGDAAMELERIPRLSFAVSGVPAAMVHRRLMDNRLVTTVSPADPLLEAMACPR